MGGISKTLGNQFKNTKAIFSGKGNLGNVGNILLGNQAFNKPGDYVVPYDENTDPFYFNQGQATADQQAINNLADQQYSDSQNFSINDQSNRESARQKLADALIRQSQATFQQGLPATMEDLNARHLLNGSGLGQEIARQQGNLAANIANQVGVQGAQDLNRASDINFEAFKGKQGQQAAGLSRVLSLQDFAKQAQIAKAIGAQAAPQMPSGKASGVSGGLAGAGTGATIGTGIAPGYGTAIGAILGGLAGYTGGSNMYSKGGK